MNQENERQKRTEFLYKVYQLTDGNTSRNVLIKTVIEELGYDKESANRIGEFLLGEGLIKKSHYRNISITNDGIKEIEGYKENKTINILFLGSNPVDTNRLRLSEENREITKALRESDFRDKFNFFQEWAVKVNDLQHHLLRYNPDIVHFCGHGNEYSELILEDNTGLAKPIPLNALSKLFSLLKKNIKCVILNACYSEDQAKAIAESIEYVIGMSKEIGDLSAINFSKAFYQALGYGENFEKAFELGCLQIGLEGLEDYEIPKLIRLSN